MSAFSCVSINFLLNEFLDFTVVVVAHLENLKKMTNLFIVGLDFKFTFVVVAASAVSAANRLITAANWER